MLESALTVASIGIKYGLKLVVQHCLVHLTGNCSTHNAIKAYELSCNKQFTNKKAQTTFQKYIEDNFEEVSFHHNKFKSVTTFFLIKIVMENKERRLFWLKFFYAVFGVKVEPTKSSNGSYRLESDLRLDQTRSTNSPFAHAFAGAKLPSSWSLVAIFHSRRNL